MLSLCMADAGGEEPRGGRAPVTNPLKGEMAFSNGAAQPACRTLLSTPDGRVSNLGQKSD